MKKREWFMVVLMCYLSIVFPVYMKLDIRYVPISLLASLSAGTFLSGILLFLPEQCSKAAQVVLTIILGGICYAECICKTILQQYYQILGGLDTAAGNHLTDYKDAVGQAILEKAGGLFLFIILPLSAAVVCAYGFPRFFSKKRKKNRKIGAICLGFTVAFHLLMLCLIFMFPWKGDFTPARLYQTDLYTDDQVEQLGLLNMLRLDIVHSIFGVSGEEAPEIREEVETAAEEPEEIVYEDNVMDLDFAALRQSAANDDTAWLCDYFSSVTPTKQNEYTGMLEGYNVIFITAEGFSGYLIDPELTPTLYRLSHEGFVFENFYSPLHFTSTSGGEFQNLTGLYPKAGFPISLTETGAQGTSLPFTLANSLNKRGYTSIGYHVNGNMYGRELSHPNLGYEWRQVTECSRPLVKETDENGNTYWPQSDDYMVQETFADYVDKQPFNIYYLTISAHLPYGYESNQMSKRNWSAVEGLPYSDKTKAYLAANLELEKGLTSLVNKLEEAGIADKTLLVMAPDHIPYSDPDILEELAGRSFGTDSLEMLDEQNADLDIYRNTCIMWAGGMEENVTISKTCSQVDILPTVLNLLGVEYDSRMLAGTDVLSETEPVVIFFSNSWRTDHGTYDRYSGTFQSAEGISMTEEEKNVYVENVKYIVSCRLRLAQLIIENDFYRLALPEG